MSKSRCPLIMTPLPHILQCTAFVFFVIACAVPDWSSGNVQATTDSAFGDFTIGLWTSCADLSQAIGEQPVSLFSPLSECRIGHCTQSSTIASGSSWDSENLCDKSAAVQAFTILSILSSILTLFFTSWRALAGRTILWGKGTIATIFTTFFSLISWATWVDWNRTMNDNRPASVTDRWLFSEMDIGAGVVLTIIGMLCCLINIFIMRSRYSAQVKAEADLKKRRQNEQSVSYATGSESVMNPMVDHNYLEVNQEPEVTHVPNIPVPQRPGSVSVKLSPAENKQTAL